MFMAGIEARPIVSKLQSYRLTRVIPLNRQRDSPPFHEQWEQVYLNNLSSHIQELPYDWRGLTVFIEENEDIQRNVGKYDNSTSPPVDEEIPLQPSESALQPRGLPSPNKPSRHER